MPGFSELNLNITNLQPKAVDQLVEHAIKLGYDNLGLATNFEFPESNKNKQKADRTKVVIPAPKAYKLPLKFEERLKSMGRVIKIYSRINVRVQPTDINTNLQHLKQKPIQEYDIISLEPTNNQVLMYLCANNYMADILTINSGIECGLIDKHLIRLIKKCSEGIFTNFRN